MVQVKPSFVLFRNPQVLEELLLGLLSLQLGLLRGLWGVRDGRRRVVFLLERQLDSLLIRFCLRR